MNYYELLFTVITTEDYQQDLLINALAEIGFDTFEETELGFKAYIPTGNFDRAQLEEQLTPFRTMLTFSYDIALIRHKNWNAVWESNFEPITIGDQLYVRATFHPSQPGFKYEIVIDPKMAFGTGHHQTTAMMLALMLHNDYKDKVVLDMGCGTGILAIMAAKLGAAKITAIDYDPVCVDSTIENALLNHVSNIRVLSGSKEVIPDERFDIILANINRNILLDQLQRYAEVLKPDGELYLSGFYENPDLDILTDAARMHGLKYIIHKTEKDWVAAKFCR